MRETSGSWQLPLVFVLVGMREQAKGKERRGAKEEEEEEEAGVVIEGKE